LTVITEFARRLLHELQLVVTVRSTPSRLVATVVG
jgi:hypothetical protein